MFLITVIIMRTYMGHIEYSIEKLERDKVIPQQTTVEISAEAMFFETIPPRNEFRGILYPCAPEDTMNRYESFLKYMNSNSYIKKASGMICDMDTAYVQTFTVKSGTAGKIIELRCPESQAISVFGKYQTVSLRCLNKSNKELDPATRTNFKKVSKYGGISRKCRATYGDLSPAKVLKYSFPKGLYLSGNEILELEVLNPDIDIERIELSMEADIFETFGQAC